MNFFVFPTTESRNKHFDVITSIFHWNYFDILNSTNAKKMISDTIIDMSYADFFQCCAYLHHAH